jgi:hypothetical protein
MPKLKILKNVKILSFLLLITSLMLCKNLFDINDGKTIWQETSIEKMAPAKSLFSNYQPDEKKYLIYSCTSSCQNVSCFRWPGRIVDVCGGLGDRLKGIMSGFLWSILTNRTFLIQSTKPFLLQESLESNVIAWHDGIDQVIEKVNNRSLTSARIQFSAQSYKHYAIDYQTRKRIKIKFFNLLTFRANADVIILKSNVDISEYIIENEFYTRRILELGILNKDQLILSKTFHTLYNLLFKMTPRLQAKFDSFINPIRSNPKTRLICAQIRLGGKTNNIHDPVLMDSKLVKRIWEFVKTRFLSKTTDYKIFITSDNDRIYEEAKSKFGFDKVFTTNGTTLHLDQYRKYHRSERNQNIQIYDKTFLDFSMLGQCDMAIVSRSGFGRLGVYNRNKAFEDIFIFKKVNKTYVFQKLF